MSNSSLKPGAGRKEAGEPSIHTTASKQAETQSQRSAQGSDVKTGKVPQKTASAQNTGRTTSSRGLPGQKAAAGEPAARASYPNTAQGLKEPSSAGSGKLAPGTQRK
jgi:hypothetical protein